MKNYFLSSTAVHAAVLGAFLLFSWIKGPSSPYIMIDGFDFVGGGGGGGGGGGPKAAQMGQVVPQPVKIPMPAKPAPVQKAQTAEETWKVLNKQSEKVPVKRETTEVPVERGEKTQGEQSNIIRRGVAEGTTAGNGSFDFGAGGGTGRGVGIGVGDGVGGGFGFGSYLRIVRQRIWLEWTQVYGSNQKCVVGLTIQRDGNVTNIKLEKSSGDSFYDTVALRAVRNASPLPPLPEGFPKSEQRFRIQFRLIE